MIDISKARPIGSTEKYPNDWMSIPELEWIAEQSSTHKRIVEVGSWKGRSTRAMADNTSGVVYAVDSWSPDPNDFPHGGFLGHGDNYGRVDINLIYEEFKANLRDHIQTNKVRPMRMTSMAAVSLFQDLDTKFDMVFIDAMHDYDYVREDIIEWSKLLVPGGLLCGHDYSDAGDKCHCPGVKRAVDELVPGFQIVPGVCEGVSYDTCRIWWKVL